MADAKQSAQDKKDEYMEMVKDLAERTPEWARSMGCFRDEDSSEIADYFIVTPATRKNRHKPNWLTWSGETTEVWHDVLEYMLENGVSICYKAFNGHYIGLPGEQGTKIGSAMNNVLRGSTVLRHIEYLLALGMVDDARDYIQKRLGAGFEVQDPLQIALAIEAFLADVGPHQKNLFMMMLTSGKDDEGV